MLKQVVSNSFLVPGDQVEESRDLSIGRQNIRDRTAVADASVLLDERLSFTVQSLNESL